MFDGGFSGPITGKYAPEKTPYLDTFHVVKGLYTFIPLLLNSFHLSNYGPELMKRYTGAVVDASRRGEAF